MSEAIELSMLPRLTNRNMELKDAIEQWKMLRLFPDDFNDIHSVVSAKISPMNNLLRHITEANFLMHQ